MIYGKETLQSSILEFGDPDVGAPDLDKSRDFTVKIDELVFRLPEHNFENATSHGIVDLCQVKDIVPDEFLDYFKKGNKSPSRITVSACSRIEREVSVSISSADRRLTFAIDQSNKIPELTFEEVDEKGGWAGVEKPYRLSWREFETGFYVISKISDFFVQQG